MELRGSKTEKNLWEAFAGESQARNKYTFFAAKARQDGYEQIGAIFDDTADNERAHAKIWFELLMENGEIPDTLTCLRMAAAGENEEHTAMYPRMAAEAKEEGFTQIAALFKKVAAIEKDHEERYKALAANIEAGKVFAREHEQVWQCRNCGFVYIGRHAPAKCPVCTHPRSYFELKSSNY
ncbi:rubrerythrin [Gemmiger sp.]|uniref:rubrerythrin n=1 Tax=Gemmiger sp. TaxID=2049027 RepID=UPI003AB160B7